MKSIYKSVASSGNCKNIGDTLRMLRDIKGEMGVREAGIQQGESCAQTKTHRPRMSSHDWFMTCACCLPAESCDPGCESPPWAKGHPMFGASRLKRALPWYVAHMHDPQLPTGRRYRCYCRCLISQTKPELPIRAHSAQRVFLPDNLEHLPALASISGASAIKQSERWKP